MHSNELIIITANTALDWPFINEKLIIMKKRSFISHLIVSTSLMLSTSFLFSCSDDADSSTLDTKKNSEVTTRNAYDDYFDWENSTKVDMVNGNGNIVRNVNLPWQLGVSNMGVPSEWIDENIEAEYSQRMYTRQKNWELVYSNISQSTSYKYIVLYNKMTGILRCFYYILTDPSSIGTTNSVWGIGVNKPTALFNYTSNVAEDASIRKNSPIYISTPVGTISNNIFSTVGFQNQVWYGLEIECAYDPQTTISNDNNLYLMGRAVDKITYNGIGNSTGNIEGTITSTAPIGAGLNIEFSNMFNTNNTVTTNQKSVGEAVGDKIENGVKEKSKFFTSLWNNIKTNAANWITSGLESGVKQGLSAIVSSGGTAIANVIGNLFNSISGSSTTSKVDLKMILNSKYKFEGEKVLPGWTNCALPVPGTKLETQANKPLYNNILGVWNLIRTPQIELYVTNYQIIRNGVQIISDKANTHAEYICNEDQSILILNPFIANDYKVTNFSCKIVQDINNCDDSNINIEPALISGIPYYLGTYISHKQSLYYHYANDYGGAKRGVVEVTFNLVNKANSNIVYYYKKHFISDIIVRLNETKYVEENELEQDIMN